MRACAAVAWAVLAAGAMGAARGQPIGRDDLPPLSPVSWKDVKVAPESFWGRRQSIIAQAAIPHNLDECEKTGRIENLRRSGRVLRGEIKRGEPEAKHVGLVFDDSDVYKVIEGAAYAKGARLPLSAETEKRVDEIIDVIAGAQWPDGYINSAFTLGDPEKRWSGERDNHETYCIGHLIEAGTAWKEATGDERLLRVAVKAADHLCATFGPGAHQHHEPPGHEEVELALVKLWRATGTQKYLALAEYLVEQRGNGDATTGHVLFGEIAQDQVPVRKQREIVGHAVRAAYLYSAVADLAGATGDRELREVGASVWRDLTERKMYITGGIGSSGHNEGFTTGYDLPNGTAYSETCAAIAMCQWSDRLGRLMRESKYADAWERGAMNAVLSGVSLDGASYFYVNRLECRGDVKRVPWFSCACCPPNICRFVAGLGGSVYAVSGTNVYINQFVAGEANITLDDRTGHTRVLRITQETNYPWEGSVRIACRWADAGDGQAINVSSVWVRIPSWCRSWTVRNVDGQAGPEVENGPNGYARIGILRTGPGVKLMLDMPVERVHARPEVASCRGRVALMRGPLVYCVEGVDNPTIAEQMGAFLLPLDAPVEIGRRLDAVSGVLAGCVPLRGNAGQVSGEEVGTELYAAVRMVRPTPFTAIPYFARANRAAAPMLVWLPETTSALKPGPQKGVKPSASWCFEHDSVAAICDRQEPGSSHDQSIARQTWWPRKGSEEWVECAFDRPRDVHAVEVYWFDDTSLGAGCAIPQRWGVEVKSGDAWVTAADGLAAHADTFDRAEFAVVRGVTAVRVKAKLREERSGGVLEMRVEP